MTAYGASIKDFSILRFRFAVITEADIFGDKRHIKRRKDITAMAIQSFRSLAIGDYVVHENTVSEYTGELKRLKPIR